MRTFAGVLLLGSTILVAACSEVVTPGPGGGGGGSTPGTGGDGPGGGAPQGVACPGSGVVCPAGTRCQIDTDGEASGCVERCDDETQACGDAACCSAGASCVSGSCQASDLVLEPLGGPDAISFVSVTVDEEACEVREGYVGGAGRRSLVRFSVILKNAGDVPLVLGKPDESDLFAPNFCEDSYVIPRFFRARVKIGDAVAAEADLDARCIAGAGGQFSCDAQGLAPGESVVQPGTTVANAIDVTGLSAGPYDLEVTVNPDKAIAESRFDNNAVVLSFDYPACSGTLCGGTCCPESYECRDDVCIVPDLHPNAERVRDTINFTYQTFAADACELAEQCVSGPGRRHLLQFEGRIENLGPGHLNPGPEADNPLFEFAQCHGHYHFKDFTDYKLLGPGGDIVAQGHKQAFCLISMSPVDPDAAPPLGSPPPGSSGCNFLSAGWADIYGVGTPCQWVDVTDVPEGDYVLRVAVNPTGSVVEASTENNVVEVPVHVPAFEPCVPEPEICGDFIDQNCNDIPDDGCMICSPRPEICGNLADENCNDVPDDGCAPIAGADDCATPGELTTSMRYAAEITAGNVPEVSLPCGGGGGEVFFHFTLPADDVVYLGTFESDIDTVLGVLPGDDCAGAPLACAAATCGADTPGASFAGRLPAGSYTVVVQAVSPDAVGTVRLNFERASCLGADAEVLPSPGVVSGDTTGAAMPVVSECSAVSPQDVYYLPLCPFRRVTVSSCGLTSFPMAVKLANDACDQSSFVCSDALGECEGDAAGARISLVTHDPGGGLGAVTVSGRTPVDFGAYSLEVSLSDTLACEAVDVGATVPQTIAGSTSGRANIVTPTCASSNSADIVHTFTAPADGTYRFDTFGSGYDTVIHVHDGVCFGPEVACNDDAGGLQSEVTVLLLAGQTVSVVVDGFGASSGPYTLHISSL